MKETKGFMSRTAFALLAAFFLVAVSGRIATASDNANVLYILAHQDDELGCAAKIMSDIRNGKNASVLWVTDGALHVPATTREKESREAMRLLGVKQENLFFLGYPDASGYKHVKEAFADALKVAKMLSPAEITSIAYEGGHIDHDLTSLIASLVVKSIGTNPPHYEFPLYNTFRGSYRYARFLPRDGTETLTVRLDKKMAQTKTSLLDVYESQASIVSPLRTIMTGKLLKEESYRATPAYDYLKPPTEGRLGYEYSTTMPRTFSDWLEYVEPFLRELKSGNGD
jgi:LmbE family N-acetylglucosaminyl deacetylase